MAERSIGPYRTLERIAIGGSAEVFTARDTRSGEHVALKVMLPGASAEGFEAEARLQESLRHPNLVAVRDYGVAGGQAYLALELVDGPSLASVLERGTLTPATAVHVAVGVLEALAAVHTARDRDGARLDIVHRDVTPQNIMFTRDGTVKLGDFGIARVRSATRTRTGMIKGKLGYLAPEQVTQSAVDARTDLYQLGLVLFEMLCSKPYFAGMTELELLRAAEAPEPKRVSEHGGPATMDAILQRALMRFPEQRYPSAMAFLADLKRRAPDLGAVDLSIVATQAPRPVRKRHVATRLSAIAVVLCALGLAAWLPSTSHEVVAVVPPAPLPRPVPAPPVLEPAPVRPAPPEPAATAVTAPTKRAKAVALPAPSPPEPVAIPEPREVAPVDVLQPCLQRLSGRGIATVDLPPSILRALGDPSSDKAALCAELDAVIVDRPFVERKLARLQAAIERLPAHDPRRPALGAATRDTLQSLLDGNVPRTNDKLHALERILEQRAQGT